MTFIKHGMTFRNLIEAQKHFSKNPIRETPTLIFHSFQSAWKWLPANLDLIPERALGEIEVQKHLKDGAKHYTVIQTRGGKRFDLAANPNTGRYYWAEQREPSMKRFTFFLNIEGTGDTAQEAWEDGMEQLLQSTASGEYSQAPATIYKANEPIDAAELLNGPPYQEFGIDHGKTECEYCGRDLNDSGECDSDDCPGKTGEQPDFPPD